MHTYCILEGYVILKMSFFSSIQNFLINIFIFYRNLRGFENKKNKQTNRKNGVGTIIRYSRLGALVLESLL